MPVLYIAIPTKLAVHATTMNCLFSCHIPGYEKSYQTMIGKSNIDQARSMLITTWYDNSKTDDLFLFLDADQTFTSQDIQALIDLNSDIAVGVYPSMAGYPCVRVADQLKFRSGEVNDILYGATGLMLIRRPLLVKMEKEILRENNGISRYYISPGFESVIPFFKQRLIQSETMNGIPEWIGEDYSFCWLARKLGGTIKCHLSPTITHEVTQSLHYFPSEYKAKEWPHKSIVYYTGKSRQTWSPMDVLDKGLGGSETAVVYLTALWKLLGYEPTVFGNVVPGIYDGVQYLSEEQFNLNDHYDTLILWRAFSFGVLDRVKANRIYVDVHDMPHSQYLSLATYADKINQIMVKSPHHQAAFQDPAFASLQKKISICQNGVINAYWDRPEVVRNRMKLIYASSYDRGLFEILQYGFPWLKKKLPEVELHVYYGSDLLSVEDKKRILPLLRQPGVFEHGKISHAEMHQRKLESSIHYYLGGQIETDCISVKESALAGCIPVVSNLGVFQDREYLLKVNGDPTKLETQLTAAQLIYQLLTNDDSYHQAQVRIQAEAQKIPSWGDVAKAWLPLFPQ